MSGSNFSSEFKWVLTYQDENTIYEEGYLLEQYALEYAEEKKLDGYKNVKVFELK